jgi:twinkle protein
MTISEKDANDMLLAKKSKEFVNAFFKAKPHRPDELLTVDDVWDEAVALPEWGRKWPWASLDRLTYGRRDGEGIYVGSAVKGGKTEWKNQMSEYIIKEEGRKIFVCAFEQSPGIIVKGVAGKIKHKQFHNPEHVDQGKFNQDTLNEAVEELRDKLIIFRASFSDVGTGNMWDRLKPAIRHAVVVEGVKDVFIDPITQLTDGMTPSETETELRRFSNEIQGMAQDLGFFYYCFAHLKEPQTGKTHEEGGSIKVAQFRGSRAMAEKTKFMLGIIRNQYADDEMERNTSTFHLLLNSGFGKAGKFDVYYDMETGAYLEPEREFV